MPRKLRLAVGRRLKIDDTPDLRVPLHGRVPTMQLRRLLLDAGRDVATRERCDARTELQIHHRRPLAQGGSNEPDNLIVLCASCHAAFEREGGPLSSS